MRFATPREAAEALENYGLTEGQIRRRTQRGEFPHIRVGGHMLIDVDAVAPILEAEAAEQRDTISTAELSEATGLKPSAIRRGVAEGWLPYRSHGSHYRFVLREVQRALMRRMEEVQDGEGG